MPDIRGRTLREIKELLSGTVAGPDRARLIEALSLDPRKGARRLVEEADRSEARARQRDARWRAFCDPERRLLEQGYRLVAGVDEAGRGPLAGPVVVGAVILPHDFVHHPLDDSKRMSAVARERAYEAVTGAAVTWSVASASACEVDRHNILGAVHLAVDRALAALDPGPEFALVDGRPLTACAVPHQAIVKGDGRSRVIAAASVLAKVTRDRHMEELDARYPGYGLAAHKGYGTLAHRAAMKRLGPSPEHRQSFMGKPSGQMDIPIGPRSVDRAGWGRRAEEAVARRYQGAGLRVRFRNWRGGGGELDLVCDHAGGWVFVEVKGARGEGAGAPAGWLKMGQRRRWRRAAAAFLESGDNDRPGAAVRFDLAAVLARRDGPPEVSVFEGVEP